MIRHRTIALIFHGLACFLFPIATILGFHFYTVFFGAPFARDASLGLAVQLVFIVFFLANILFALTSSLKAKAAFACALAAAVLIYFLPEHPLRGLFFAGVSGGLSLLAIYASRQLAQIGKNT